MTRYWVRKVRRVIPETTQTVGSETVIENNEVQKTKKKISAKKKYKQVNTDDN